MLLPDRVILMKLFCLNRESVTVSLLKFRSVKGMKTKNGLILRRQSDRLMFQDPMAFTITRPHSSRLLFVGLFEITRVLFIIFNIVLTQRLYLS
ncbi:hypothetical protein TNIN_476561 [Trichonephila inaurata madagascariensis]|uniref:Uncharacterized protein n=1 Tax=Trichonephila inaurata madagascariensis TaxID=2747483 RepID=A0A8X6Y1V9_9ARAC|nr:hypothetical protein TNIN_476561 [Trichonephila inaurata madagascariensis]